MSESSSAAAKDGHSLETLSFREYRQADSQRWVEIMASAWPKLTRSIHLASVEWYVGSATWKETACVSDTVVGILFGKIDSDLTSLGRLRIFLTHATVYLKLLFGFYGRLPHSLTCIKNGISSERKIASSLPDVDGEITFFAVDVAYRRKGIGKALVGRFIDHAKKKGARRIFVYTTDPGSDWAFYERYGFRKYSSFRDSFMSFAWKEEVTAIIYILDIERQSQSSGR